MPKKKITKKEKVLSFQDIIMNLQKFWGKYGCVILQPYDIEVGAGTFHPATTLRSLGPSLGRQLMFSHHEDQRMEDMVKILIDYSIITNFKLSLNLHLKTLSKLT